MHQVPPLSPDSRAIIAVLREQESKNEQRINQIISAQRALQADVTELSKGFPDNDPESHRRYHESVIEWRELRNKMIRESLLHVAKLGTFSGLAWCIYIFWIALKMELTR